MYACVSTYCTCTPLVQKVTRLRSGYTVRCRGGVAFKKHCWEIPDCQCLTLNMTFKKQEGSFCDSSNPDQTVYVYHSLLKSECPVSPRPPAHTVRERKCSGPPAHFIQSGAENSTQSRFCLLGQTSHTGTSTGNGQKQGKLSIPPLLLTADEKPLMNRKRRRELLRRERKRGSCKWGDVERREGQALKWRQLLQQH